MVTSRPVWQHRCLVRFMERSATSAAFVVQRVSTFALALIIAGGAAPIAKSDDEVRPRLLDGAVFWVGNPLTAKGKKTAASVTALAFSPDGQRLIIGEDNG